MHLRLFAFALIRLLLAAPLCAGGAPPAGLSASAIAVQADADRTIVTLRLDGQPDFESFALTDPDRLVLDFPEMAWPAAPPAPAGLAAGLRYGLAAPGRSRLVIDLAAPARLAAARYRAEGGGAALSLELAPESRAAFDAAAGWPPALGPLVPGPAPADRLRIALDPGHGGIDGGAVRGGLTEKTVTLAFARALAQRLEAAGFEVTLTRDRDVFVPLDERVRRAAAARADLLLSLHADVVLRGEASGVSVYTLSAEASDAEAAALAERADAADALAGGAAAGAGRDVARALIDLVRADALAASGRLGETLVAAFRSRVPVLSGRPLRSAGFRVLKSPDIPSALIELGFLSSAEDRARLTDPEWRDRAIAAVVAAVEGWAAARPAPRVAAE